MNTHQIEWAKQHDWFRAYFSGPDGLHVVVADIVRQQDGEVIEQEIQFGNFRKLQEWAGY